MADEVGAFHSGQALDEDGARRVWDACSSEKTSGYPANPRLKAAVLAVLTGREVEAAELAEPARNCAAVMLRRYEDQVGEA